jgi:hypothetical protein
LKALSTDLFGHGTSILPCKNDNQPGRRDRGAIDLTNVFDVTDDAIIDGVALVIEAPIVMPVDVAIGVEIFADNCASDVWGTIDREIGTRGVKYRGETSG